MIRDIERLVYYASVMIVLGSPFAGMGIILLVKWMEW